MSNIEGSSGQIYDSALESMTNQYFRLQQLQQEGHPVSKIMMETWENIQEIIDNQKLRDLKKELAQIKTCPNRNGPNNK
jgi:hypothetical protein